MRGKSSKQLYNKLFFTYTAVIAGTVAALMFYFISSMHNRFLEQNLDYMQMMHQEAVNYIDSCSDISDYLHEDIYNSDMEMKDLIHYLTDDPEIYQKYRLDSFSEFQSNAYKGVDSFAAEAFEAYNSLKRIAFVSYSKGDMTYFTGSKKVYHNQDGSPLLERIQNGNLADQGEFSFLKEIRDPVTMQSMGGMVLTFETGKFDRIQEDYPVTGLLVYNKSRTVIYDSSGKHEVEEIEKAREGNYLEKELNAYIQTLDVENYHVIGYLEKQFVRIPLPLVLMIVGVGLLTFLVGELLVQYHLRRLSVRLNQILDGMTQVMGGQLDVRLAADHNGDELDVISRHFNEMCEKLNLHVRKRYLAEIEQKNAEISALQSQINPHFLYNTLEAIRMKAVCNGDREVGKMLYSMAVIFRSQIKEADVITLAQELHYCKKYLELFEYRYPNQFQASVDCPIEYMNVPIIKFVLQPIIENYFIHGIRLREADNFIRIAVVKDGEDYEIIVEDNGQGMTEEEIAAKNKQLQENKLDKSKSIGIANVNRRVKAVYGEKYGVRVEAASQAGLRVVLRFKPDEGEEHEESNDCGR